jgi:hydroxymethylglutaryl-CoA lyase
MANFPSKVKIVEVGARDGLQNEHARIWTATKVELIDRLSACGLKVIEASSFVSPKWVPQLSDAEDVYTNIVRAPGVSYPALVPNVQGMQRALKVGVEEIAVFTAASETFNQRNINASISESIERFEPVMDMARAAGVRVRGYVSCVLGCPYEGKVSVDTVATVARELLQLGCYEVSLGDTIGMGTPRAARVMLERVAREVPMEHLGLHFHDTRGQALANLYACLEMGAGIIDSAVAGLGGCPYANGATGNVATEDVLYMLHGMGIETGVDLERLLEAGRFISAALNRAPASKLGRIGKL